MKTIIAACITGGLTFVGTVIVAVLGYLKHERSDFQKAKEDRTSNTQEIIDSGRENTEKLISLEISNSKEILNSGTEILSKISSVKEMMIEEKTANQYRYQNMNDAQKDIATSVKTLDSFSKEMGRLIQQNAELKQQYQQLQQQYQQLKQQNQTLEQKYENLVRQMEDDVLSVIPKTGRDDRDDLER